MGNPGIATRRQKIGAHFERCAAAAKSGVVIVRSSRLPSGLPPKGEPKLDVLPTATATATVGNMGTAPTYRSAASNCSATSNHSAATINSATVVAATIVTTSTTILIVWITVATAIITAAAIISASTYNCCSPSNNRSPAIHGATPNCTASVAAASI